MRASGPQDEIFCNHPKIAQKGQMDEHCSSATDIFYNFERQAKGPPCRFLHAGPNPYATATLPIMLGTPLPEQQEDLCRLLDNNAKYLVQGESEGDAKESADDAPAYTTATHHQLTAPGQL